MSPQPKLKVRQIEFQVLPTKTRFPFRYGIAAMTEAPHWIVHSTLEIEGRTSRGITSEGLPPKWFTKNPETTFEDDDLPGMERVIRHACETAAAIDRPLDFFEFWREVKSQQDAWAEAESIPELLAQFGVAMVERTVLDGLCRFLENPLHELVSGNLLGIDPGLIHRDLSGTKLEKTFQNPPLPAVAARHTIGLADPLTDSDIPEDEQIEDGLPHSLEANIDTYGLTHFKVKLCGDLHSDRDRLREITTLLKRAAPPDYQITIDGNEQYRDIESFQDHFLSHRADSQIAPLFEHLLFVEQPIHRDLALDDSVRTGFERWTDPPRVIIDESDSSVSSLPRALSIGYSGTSHKNCKGIVKSLVNRALIDRNRGIMSAEDLANIGPIAVLQDLAMVALLGISHVERNGHHYFAGLSMFPRAIQEKTLKLHPDLYRETDTGIASLRIEDGMVSTNSINNAPFGVGLEPRDFEEL